MKLATRIGPLRTMPLKGCIKNTGSPHRASPADGIQQGSNGDSILGSRWFEFKELNRNGVIRRRTKIRRDGDGKIVEDGIRKSDLLRLCGRCSIKLRNARKPKPRN
ncbi:hypothetical protein KQX54_019256 [Cotesia glomerata]|uniref:Uncharacterized protein n=1 Tax=Cotesia glomerata TaxID=32391 RepID=A0AAV7IX45_COTGL|nr:hypothetical protein KQX54_019256 [Cotesia glomerata]